MSVPRTASENVIRAATVAKARELWPSARIIHELNVEHGQTRADLAIVTADKLILVEIKSSADTLDRLPSQLRDFAVVSHGVIVVADEKWCVVPEPEKKGNVTHHIQNPIRNVMGYEHTLWKFEGGTIVPEMNHTTLRPWPWAQRMLYLLWRSELEAAYHSMRICIPKRAARGIMVDEILKLCRQPEIEAAVLSALRSRKFVAVDEAA